MHKPTDTPISKQNCVKNIAKMAVFIQPLPCTAYRTLCDPSRPKSELPATLASEPGHSLATSHPLPPYSVDIGHGICTAAPFACGEGLSITMAQATAHMRALELAIDETQSVPLGSTAGAWGGFFCVRMNHLTQRHRQDAAGTREALLCYRMMRII